jgi:N-acetylglucosaminyldiphosphoundecaprenol N-acetyl-beta-D-mannosaminyltransferase
MKRSLLGYHLDVLDARECVAEVAATIQAAQARSTPVSASWLACLNPHSYAVALDDAEFAGALRAANWLIPDGIGVVWAGRLLGLPIRERVTGYDVFDGLLRALQSSGAGNVFLLGSSEAILQEMIEKFAKDFPAVRVCGHYSPPFAPSFSEAENDKMSDLINASGADVLFVSLSAPKQEKWIHAMRGRLRVPFIAAIGAVFDFYTGNVRRSAPIFQKLGLEWLPRLVQEPRRLWRRMLVSAPRFVWDVLRARLGRQ